MNYKNILILVVVGGLGWWFLTHYNSGPVKTPESNTPIAPPAHVAENPEGEADPARMTLFITTWNWISTQYNDGTKVVPKLPGKFTLTFKKDGLPASGGAEGDQGTFSASTDCNGIGGNYVDKNKMLTFKDMLGTLMYCDGSQEADFKKILENTSSYIFTSRGELILQLKYDSGTATFR